MKDASKIYTDFEYLNLEGLDLSKYEKMPLEKGWEALKKELLNRVKEGVVINDDVLDEIDAICVDTFLDKMERVKVRGKKVATIWNWIHKKFFEILKKTT